MEARVTAGDIEWIDANGHGRVCGHQVRKTDILALEQPDDRRPDGHLTAAAKDRIAEALAAQLRDRDARALAVWNSQGRSVTWRQCEG